MRLDAKKIYTHDVCGEMQKTRLKYTKKVYKGRMRRDLKLCGEIKRMTHGLQKKKYTTDVYIGRMRRDLRRDLVLGLRSRATRRGGPKVQA